MHLPELGLALQYTPGSGQVYRMFPHGSAQSRWGSQVRSQFFRASMAERLLRGFGRTSQADPRLHLRHGPHCLGKTSFGNRHEVLQEFREANRK